MAETPDAPEPTPRVQRHPRHPLAGEPRRRLQFGTGYPHRGPAPACPQRQCTYQPPKAGQSPGGIGNGRAAGRLRVLNLPRES